MHGIPSPYPLFPCDVKNEEDFAIQFNRILEIKKKTSSSHLVAESGRGEGNKNAIYLQLRAETMASMSLFSLLISIYSLGTLSSDATLTEDPSSWPGHLKPLGTGRPIKKVAELQGFPEPHDFFKNYVHTKPQKAVIFKGGAKLSPAFDLWTDDYLVNHPQSEEMEFDVEVGKKETRSGEMEKRTIKKFIETFRKDDIYAVTDVPDKLRHQFVLPPVIRCNNIKDKLSMMLMWYSSGGTKSVLHQDSFENINCLYRGSKRLLIAEYPKFKKEVVIDRPNGYSAVDIDKVDFTKYPGLNKVEYWEANMEEGDCLYIPFQWFHQVTSFANENKTNMAVNVWWYKNNSYSPEDCTMSPSEATLDKFKFGDATEKAYGNAGGEEQSQGSPTSMIGMFFDYFKEKNTGEISLEEFSADIQKSEGSTLIDLGVGAIPNKKRREKFVKIFYEALDVDKNGKLDFNDFNSLDDAGDEEAEGGSGEAARNALKAVNKAGRLLDRYFEWLDAKEKKENPQAEDGTQEPEDGTQEPEDGTQEPEDGTQEPEDGTQEPEDGTQEPEDGTQEWQKEEEAEEQEPAGAQVKEEL
eukprot:Seg3163.3 transcript_id=Seg3163.3/GoldUCD/mRNA.D3Y31 product="Lysine-specific demethylase JMJ30" protein_id=Seg3163.3/GoldUCD/D3Y31